MRSLPKLLALAALATLAVAPVAAQAGTRAESAPVAVDVQRSAGSGSGESEIGLLNPAWLLLFLAAVAPPVAAVAGRSRG